MTFLLDLWDGETQRLVSVWQVSNIHVLLALSPFIFMFSMYMLQKMVPGGESIQRGEAFFSTSAG